MHPGPKYVPSMSIFELYCLNDGVILEPMRIDNPQNMLIALFEEAVGAADPRNILAGFLPANTQQKVTVIGAGKAAASMALALESHWQGEVSGLVVTRTGHSLPCKKIEVIEASHPVPDHMGEEAARRILKKVENLTENDLVICLLSGGGSSLLAMPAAGLTLADKQQINKALLKSGASISEINSVRKHLSAIKGGRLAVACAPAKIITYAISDVPGDFPSVIASGPTVADESSRFDALEVLEKYKISASKSVLKRLNSDASETLKSAAPELLKSEFQLVATPAQSLQAAIKKAESMGLRVLYLGDDVEGEARDVAKSHAALVQSIQNNNEPVPAPCLILSGGETSVTIKGSGRGGRNTEYLLSLANCLQGRPGVYALAADTDGIDGSEDNAGAMLSPQSWHRGVDEKLNAADILENNDAYSYFKKLDDLLMTGPTLTNVNDFRAILVFPMSSK